MYSVSIIFSLLKGCSTLQSAWLPTNSTLHGLPSQTHTTHILSPVQHLHQFTMLPALIMSMLQAQVLSKFKVFLTQSSNMESSISVGNVYTHESYNVKM